jgi:hypothetical protein
MAHCQIGGFSQRETWPILIDDRREATNCIDGKGIILASNFVTSHQSQKSVGYLERPERWNEKAGPARDLVKYTRSESVALCRDYPRDSDRGVDNKPAFRQGLPSLTASLICFCVSFRKPG